MNKSGNKLSSSNIAYQQDVLDTFNKRVSEIELFFDLIDRFEAVNPTGLISVDDKIHLITESDLTIPIGGNVENTLRTILHKMKVEPLDVDVINIFKSNTILLFYNLIESTISNVDKFILKEINSKVILYSDATDEIKRLWIQHISEFNKREYLNKAISLLDGIETININIEKQINDNEKEFGGSLDPRRIDEYCSNYGIEVTKIKMMRQEDERTSVRNIVSWRNELAHGKYSFANFGRNLRYNTPSIREKDILFIKKSCFLFLEVFLTNVEDFIDNQKYKK